MNTTLRRDADEIICSSIQAVLPDKAVCRALEDFQPGGGRVLLVAAGKAAWQMAHAAAIFRTEIMKNKKAEWIC